MTPMGTALKMAKDMIDDKNETPSRIYRPAVVLVSDGAPNDDWKGPMDKFINDGRSAKCQRFAVAIGNDADRKVLERFTKDPNAVFFAEDAKDISEQFKTITMRIVFHSPIKKDEITKRNVLSDVLLQSTSKYSSKRSMIIEAEDLYAADIYNNTHIYRYQYDIKVLHHLLP